MTTLEKQITEQFGKIIKKFPILHHGWDGDGYGYVIEDKEYKLVLTNHSKPYLADASELMAKINQYQQAIGETNEAINLLQ